MAEDREKDKANDAIPWDGRILVVANLSYDVRPCDLRDLFLQRGKVYRVDIERSKMGGSNGLGFVEFATKADCESAAELHGTQFKGRTLKCKVSSNPPPELIRYYVRPIDHRPVNFHTREKIIDEARNGPSEPTPMPQRDKRLSSRPRRQHGEENGDAYSDYSYGYSDNYSSEYSD